MKIKSLNIDSYRHLENISFDFTYPKEHQKAGEPLDKICIIGQSATGKTNILELLKSNISLLGFTEILNGQYIWRSKAINFDGNVEYLYKGKPLLVQKDKIVKGELEFKNLPLGGGGSVTNLLEESVKLFYFTSEIISRENINIFNQHPLTIIDAISSTKDEEIKDRQVSNYEFSQNLDPQIWFSILHKILDYRKRFTQMASELINKGAIGDLSKLNKEYQKWSRLNENPLISFAEYLNPILEKLNLEVDLVNTEYVIPIKSKINEEVIPVSGLSTGTKGLLLSLFPLFELDTTDSIILFDEPERSLFPDMQVELISHYQKITSSSQLIVATHSPFIAAAFEPEERFILYFDKNGKVAVRKGESPIGDDPNDILKNDFNVDYYNNFGKQAYQNYLELKRQASQETEPQKKKELIVEMAKLGDKYNF